MGDYLGEIGYALGDCSGEHGGPVLGVAISTSWIHTNVENLI